MNRTGLLLAAGTSRRFGVADKLLAPLDGRPLVAHAAQAMQMTALDRHIAVIANPELRPYLDGFEIVEIQPGAQSDSLRAGLQAAGETDRLLIALADMPRVTSELLDMVVAAATDDRPAACHDLGPPMPPACFPRGWLIRLAELTGDQGAGRLIRDLPAEALVNARGLLTDIDTVSDLAKMKKTAR
ncbi:nucleotidyltransferase family protein [Paracoccus saliphilus]|uniref:Molybdenum cofactor cytidylyltransferase n=1 Tax=Paracoccus saliphilus TaxID=405559 RepID=A0AA46A4Z4_9RHOB|nr:nucleotidyltransferase family protein [Paracoccus saliphilus]WCR04985.1 nucleotidyltransferase family protein [Paracoccus saliphilus]SIS71694.1 molybdenum cofactor cytidylyltransferase [Paracoccus saliphilus]